MIPIATSLAAVMSTSDAWRDGLQGWCRKAANGGEHSVSSPARAVSAALVRPGAGGSVASGRFRGAGGRARRPTGVVARTRPRSRSVLGVPQRREGVAAEEVDDGRAPALDLLQP